MSEMPSEPVKNQHNTVDITLEALSHEYRFQLLRCLREESPIEAVIPHVIDGMEGDPEIEAVEIEMYHHHLPKLEREGFIKWEREHDQVRKGPEFDRIEKLFDRLTEDKNDEPVFR
ncbi:DUF7344 domain-containing protein [Halopiger aswanensis]|uniref:DUF7344 domain-containing protein n=1 Tax=Halopiger aswanensis TaxID=148449 RepID=A0A3R7HFL4_9EURY|nr:helix-turn-helix transcriptional regulator [Halopiger aswanensis]RKD85930.1 hypothetical protein ATJ93_4703 [Halopiger aswanensis]